MAPLKTVTWTARVEWRNGYEPGQTTVDAWVDRLADHSPVIAHEHRLEGSWRMSATITVEAPSLRQAVQAAVRLVEDAVTVAHADGVEVLTAAEYTRRLAEPQIPPLVGLADIAAKLEVSRQRASQLAERADFPPIAARTAAGPLFIEAQVDTWAATWERKPGRPAGRTDQGQAVTQ